MADKRILLLAPEDLLLYAASSDEAVRSMFVQAFRVAQAKVASNEPEYTDSAGEIHQRRWRLIFGEDLEDLTVKQRGFLHACIFPQVAEQVRVEGVRYTADIWKEFYRKLFLPDVFKLKKVPRWDPALCALVQPKRATPHRQRVSTEDLNIRQYSEHIDRVIAHATTEFGVVFNFDQQEREAVRWKAKKRKPAAQREEVAA